MVFEIGPGAATVLLAIIGFATTYLKLRQDAANRLAEESRKKLAATVEEIKTDVNSNASKMEARLTESVRTGKETQDKLEAVLREGMKQPAAVVVPVSPLIGPTAKPVPVTDKVVAEAVKEMHADLGRKADETLDNTK